MITQLAKMVVVSSAQLQIRGAGVFLAFASSLRVSFTNKELKPNKLPEKKIWSEKSGQSAAISRGDSGGTGPSAGRYVANVSIIFDAPCLFDTNLYMFSLHFFCTFIHFPALTY
jgi:hypothetical protein